MADGSGVPEIEGIVDLEVVGSGGFSTVYVGTDVAFKRRVAIKLLHNLDEHGRRRFDRELELMGRLDNHPHVITPYRTGFGPSGSAYLIMEYAEGGSMQDLLDKRGRLTWSEAVENLRPILSALEAAHNLGVLHLDVKPANILLTQSGAKLTDFGISQVRGSATSSVAYTLYHTPPETFSGGSECRDERSDLYSWASTLFTLVTGYAPFQISGQDSEAAHMGRILHQPVPPSGLGLAIDQFFSTSLAKYPDDRSADASALALAVDSLKPDQTGAVIDQGLDHQPRTSFAGPVTLSAPPGEAVSTTPPVSLSSRGPNWSTGRQRLVWAGAVVTILLAGVVLAALGGQLPGFGDRSPKGDAKDDLVNAELGSAGEGDSRTDTSSGPSNPELDNAEPAVDPTQATTGAAPGSGTSSDKSNDPTPEGEGAGQKTPPAGSPALPTPAEDQAVAERVMILESDLGQGWTAASNTRTREQSGQAWGSVPECEPFVPWVLGEAETAIAGRDVSYSSGNRAVFATVAFYHDEAAAVENGPAQLASLDYQRCLRALISESIMSTNPEATNLITESAEVPVASYGQTREAVTFLTSFTLPSLGDKVQVTDELRVQIGRAVLTVVWSGEAKDELDPSQVRLWQALTERFQTEMAAYEP